MLRPRRFVPVGVLVVSLTSCAAVKAAPPRVVSATSTTVPTTNAPPPTRTIPIVPPSQVSHLGGTFDLTATNRMSTELETAAVHITLDQVIDPALVPGGRAPSAGSRDVEVKVTVTNVGDVTVPNQEGGEYILSLQWALDPDIANQDRVPGSLFEGLPFDSCGAGGQEFLNGVAPGQTVTGCVPFTELPDGTAVSSASVLLVYAGIYNGAPAEWLIP